MNAWLTCHQCRVFDVLTFIEGALSVYLYIFLCERLPRWLRRRHFVETGDER